MGNEGATQTDCKEATLRAAGKLSPADEADKLVAQEIYETLSFRSLTQTSKKPVPGQGMPHSFSFQKLIKLLTLEHYATSAVVIPLNQDYA